MRFGTTINRDEPADMDPRDFLKIHVERAHAARDLGFDLLTFSHRYSIGPAVDGPRGKPLVASRMQPLVLMGYIAAEMGDTVRYGTNVLTSMATHPVQLAEEVATLDKLCHGRLSLGIGLGWMQYEFDAFGVDRKTAARRFEELLELYRLLLTEDRVTYEGEFFQADDCRMLARCVQEPMAPLWIGASVDRAVKRVARLGDAWIASGHIPAADLGRQKELFRAEREAHGLPMPTEWPVVRSCYIAESREEARELAEPALRAWYKQRGEWGWFMTAGQDDALADDAWSRGRWIIGDPEDCIEQIKYLEETFGATDIIVSYQGTGPGSDPASRMRTLELFGERVIPYCRD